MRSDFENRMKKELENRELPVSNDAWDRLSQMLEEEHKTPKKPKRRLFIPLLIAASLALIFGALFFMLNNEDINTNPIEIVNQPGDDELDPARAGEIESDPDRYRDEFELKTPVVKEQIATFLKSEELKINSQKPLKKEKVVMEEIKTPEKVQVAPTVIAANEIHIEESISESIIHPVEVDSLPVIVQSEETAEKPKEVKKYTDPELLLYSIENNDVIKQTKSNTGWVVIDLNK